MFWRIVSARGRCSRAQRMLADRSCALLSPSRQRWLDGHLQDCPACRVEDEVLDRVLALVDAVPPVAPPQGIWERIEGDIRSAQQAPGRLRRPLVPALATGAALVAAAGLYLRAPAPDPAPPLPAESIAYIRSHALGTSGQPLADRVGIVSFVTAAGRYRQEGGGNW